MAGSTITLSPTQRRGRPGHSAPGLEARTSNVVEILGTVVGDRGRSRSGCAGWRFVFFFQAFFFLQAKDDSKIQNDDRLDLKRARRKFENPDRKMEKQSKKHYLLMITYPAGAHDGEKLKIEL